MESVSDAASRMGTYNTEEVSDKKEEVNFNKNG